MKKLPVFRGKTAFDLLDTIKKLALAEPKRIDMNHWRNEMRDKTPSRRTPAKGYPACGMVGCIGGWTDILTKQPRSEDAYSGKAAETLGLAPLQARELFWDSRLIGEASLYESSDGVNNAQTPKHAEHVAAHITAFQIKYEAQLKAKKIKVVRK